MTPPPHPAYFQLSAVFVAVQGISYLVVWRDPRANLGLVWVGVLYKAAYTGLAVWYLLTNNMPAAFFVPWAVADAAFMVAFLLFLRAVGRQPVR